jgi:hypothetical protein
MRSRDRCSIHLIKGVGDLDCSRRVEIEPEKIERIEVRIDALRQYLLRECPQCFTEQKHVREHARQERTYWHYGYLVALRDVLRLIDSKHHSGDNGDSCPSALPDESRYRVD